MRNGCRRFGGREESALSQVPSPLFDRLLHTLPTGNAIMGPREFPLSAGGERRLVTYADPVQPSFPDTLPLFARARGSTAGN
jgi:hypothetical protein